jgi:flagellar motility protein MotE (MotC chaperone)
MARLTMAGMPPSATDLAAAIADMRTGRGKRQQELRQRLRGIDGDLRQRRNIEKLRHSQLRHQLQSLDTRAESGAVAKLQATLSQSARRLEALDDEIAREIAKLVP